MPNQREKSDNIQIKFRMKEALRAQIEQAASNRGVNMTEEAVRRLQQSFHDEEIKHRTDRTDALVRLLVGTIHLVEDRTGGSWVSDGGSRDVVTATMVAFLNSEHGVPFNKPPLVDEEGNWLNDNYWLKETTKDAIYDLVWPLMEKAGMTPQTIEMMESLWKTNQSRPDYSRDGEDR